MTRPVPTDEPSGPLFLVDAMLGNVARDLRLLGYDAEFGGRLTDSQLLRIAQSQRRILVTRDHALARRARNLRCLLLTEKTPRLQVVEVLASLRLGASPGGPFSRCLTCNGRLAELTLGEAAPAVPDHIATTIRNFWGCSACRRVYWPGTHRSRLQERIRGVLEALLLPGAPV